MPPRRLVIFHTDSLVCLFDHVFYKWGGDDDPVQLTKLITTFFQIAQSLTAGNVVKVGFSENVLDKKGFKHRFQTLGRSPVAQRNSGKITASFKEDLTAVDMIIHDNAKNGIRGALFYDNTVIGDDTAKKFLDNCMSHFISKFEKKLQEFDPIIEGAISKPESIYDIETILEKYKEFDPVLKIIATNYE